MGLLGVGPALSVSSRLAGDRSRRLGERERCLAALRLCGRGVSAGPASIRPVVGRGGGAGCAPLKLLPSAVAAATLPLVWRCSACKVGGAAGGVCPLLRRRLVPTTRCFLFKVRRIWFLRRGAGGSSRPCRWCLRGAVHAGPSGWMRGGKSPSGVESAVAVKAPHSHRCHGGQGHLPCRMTVMRSWQDRISSLRTCASAVR